MCKSERQARFAEVSALQAQVQSLQQEIQQLRAENRRLRRSRIGATETFNKQKLDMEQEIQQLKEELEKANKTIAWFQKEYFGRKTETAESLAIAPKTVQEESEHQPEKRKRGQKSGKGNGHGRSDRSNLERREITTNPPNCACDVCNKPYRRLSKTDDCETTEIDEVKPFVQVCHKTIWVSQCDCKGKVIIKGPPPPRLYPCTTIGNSLWVYLLVWKYIFGVPTNRVLQKLSLQGLHLSAGTVTGGMKVIDTMLLALYEQIVDHCRGADLWNGDETSWKIVESDGQQWWFWVFACMDAIVYLLDKSRSKEVPKDFFAGSAGVLVTDRLKSYLALNEAIKNAWCWVHQRRDLLKLFQGMPSLKDWSKEWLAEIGRLFALNQKRMSLWQAGQDWREAHLAVEEQVRKLEERWQLQIQEPDLHEEQRKILNSFMNHWIGLTLFLIDPRIPLSNNRAERLLRPLVINRKNSYGNKQEWSGHLAAKLFTVFQTWQANGLNPQALLLDYFNECSKTPGRAPPNMQDFLPWSMSKERKEKYRLPKNIKRPA